MRFVDLARIEIRSGSGGNGVVSFRREKYVEHGGPDGGRGGNGGSVYARVVEGLNTLIDFRYRRHISATSGKPGMGGNRTGKAGSDAVIDLPAGTEILDEDRSVVLHDMTEVGQVVLLAEGGNGGFGNHQFRSSRNQTPRMANEGMPGVSRTLWLRLKVLADVGLVGLPNAGKSTLLAALSNARPKIAEYPFTTLQPNLGMIEHGSVEFVMADIPGLVEGAHLGKGVGDRFLSHLERCTTLLHLVDLTAENPAESCRTITHELASYGRGMEDKDLHIVGTKSDAIDPSRRGEIMHTIEQETGCPVWGISAVSGMGLDPLLDQIVAGLHCQRRATDCEANPEPWVP
ncbi:MAG: GTPase ObgE [Rhodobacteraceae bacterium]|nr:GTPase ObgE [Paracoccaceae bacterium]